MATKILVNMPVKDLDKSIAFFTTVGYTFNPQFTSENAACMTISDTIYAMLMVDKFFKTFTNREIPDAAKSIGSYISLSVDSRAEVDELLSKAKVAGATIPDGPDDEGFMYSQSFFDLDGHGWNVFFMESSPLQG